MKIYKILNLYACLGGNRYKWDDVAKQGNFIIKVTAIELDPELARLYQIRFPNDKVIITDAHQYLLEHYQEYDFIWASPPCPTHSRIKLSQAKGKGNHKPCYPDFTLYQEVVFLDNYYDGKYCVENVIPYYEPLIPAQKRGRHLYWCNFKLPKDLGDRNELTGLIANKVDGTKKLCKLHEIDLSDYHGEQRKDKIARNLVDFEAGKTILQTAFNVQISEKDTQQKLFNN